MLNPEVFLCVALHWTLSKMKKNLHAKNADSPRRDPSRQKTASKDSWLEGDKSDLLGFVDFGHLGSIIVENWKHFESIVPSQALVEAANGRTGKARNFIAHKPDAIAQRVPKDLSLRCRLEQSSRPLTSLIASQQDVAVDQMRGAATNRDTINHLSREVSPGQAGLGFIGERRLFI